MKKPEKQSSRVRGETEKTTDDRPVKAGLGRGTREPVISDQ